MAQDHKSFLVREHLPVLLSELVLELITGGCLGGAQVVLTLWGIWTVLDSNTRPCPNVMLDASDAIWQDIWPHCCLAPAQDSRFGV